MVLSDWNHGYQGNGLGSVIPVLVSRDHEVTCFENRWMLHHYGRVKAEIQLIDEFLVLLDNLNFEIGGVLHVEWISDIRNCEADLFAQLAITVHIAFDNTDLPFLRVYQAESYF